MNVWQLVSNSYLRALGTRVDNDRGPNLEYPLAFLDAFIKVLEPRNGKEPFRYIHLSGKFVVQDQSKPLWLLEAPRKIKVSTFLAVHLYSMRLTSPSGTG
jgi:hypothetical protein